MKRNERSSALRLLAAWRQTLAQCNHLAVETDDVEMLEAIPGVRDYIIEQIEVCEGRLNLAPKLTKITPGSAQFAAGDNRPHNQLAEGVNDAG